MSRYSHSNTNTNKAYVSASDAESGIADTMSRAPSSVYMSNSNNKTAPSSVQYMNNLLNNSSSVSYDIYGTSANKLATRYDLKSQSSVSLYGSKKSLPCVVSLDPANSRNQAPFSKQSSKKKFNLKKFLMKKLLISDSDSYASGEYDYNNDKSEKSFDTSSNKIRENWSGECDFLLSCLGYSVGLGAIWRFPYLVYSNGGGVFLIPYFIFLFLVGIPLFFLELNLGQYTSQGAVNCWKMAPIFKGIGISMNFASLLLCIYYNMIIAYSIYYLVLSLRPVLDWSQCDYSWASKNCTDDYSNFIIKCSEIDVVRGIDGMCYNYSGINGRTPIGWWDIRKRIDTLKPVLPAEDFFNNYVLEKSSSIENGGQLVWQLVLCLLGAWIIVFLCVFKGIKSSGKIVYFTAIFPYVILFILGIFGWTLPGASKGIEFYMRPNFSKLLSANVWFDAAVQIFFTMSTSYGGLITLASYNKFNRNTLKDTFIITLGNSLTSIFAGFVVFGFIGYISHLTYQDVNTVVTSGPGLSFIIFPFAVTKLNASPFWSSLFFIMVLTLGLDSEFTTLETIITSLTDSFPKLRKHKLPLILSLCVALFLLGLPYCTKAGFYWIELMDKFSGGWSILIIGTLECICIAWVYGVDNFRKDISLMIGEKYTNNRVFWYWTSTWCVVSPAFLIALVIFSWIDYKPLRSGNNTYPAWSQAIGWLITAFVLSGIVFWAIYLIFDALLINKRPLSSLFKPQSDWGPLKVENKRNAIHLPNLAAFHRRDISKKKQNESQFLASTVSREI